VKKPVKNLPASVNARLANLARETGGLFNEVLQYYAIERFLFRLSCSPHRDHFILKGGLIFYARQLPLRRPTRDIDLQASASNAVTEIERSLREICTQPVDPDGMTFDPASVMAERIMKEAALPGVGAKCLAYLGTAQIPIQLDISYANVITPAEIEIAYPTLFDSPEPQLRAYPYETVVAEKLQALVFLGSINDRLKDFYDLWLLSEQVAFEGPLLCEAIRATFTQRRTPIPTVAPVALLPAFAQAKQRQWRAFLGKLGFASATVVDFDAVLVRLREFLLPPGGRGAGCCLRLYLVGRGALAAMSKKPARSPRPGRFFTHTPIPPHLFTSPSAPSPSPRDPPHTARRPRLRQMS
jgi:predicted nucleotidyltransferase component of viral defense system